MSPEEKALLADVEIARTTVNLGHSLRAQSKVKVRQPLARIFVVADPAGRAAILRQTEVISEELNIKAMKLSARESDLVTYRVLPDNRKLGPRFGADFPKVRAALAAIDPAIVVSTTRPGSRSRSMWPVRWSRWSQPTFSSRPTARVWWWRAQTASLSRSTPL